MDTANPTLTTCVMIVNMLRQSIYTSWVQTRNDKGYIHYDALSSISHYVMRAGIFWCCNSRINRKKFMVHATVFTSARYICCNLTRATYSARVFVFADHVPPPPLPPSPPLPSPPPPGEGTFGRVLQARAEGIVAASPYRNIVAVKTIRGEEALRSVHVEWDLIYSGTSINHLKAIDSNLSHLPL